ncbi:unnamed protein product [Psylliodes chrysocephalus]|uniref:Uncharacterized protein n=1 Tax=Psylliodes chrysocephalus TaxID=3402493 RepID=A0A9P0CI63_9CUCU|nr:unnamed protein product [Psylliodes chrysocephala]
MAGDSVNETIKCLSLPAALIGTIQSVVWLLLALTSILYYNDIIELSNSLSPTSYGNVIYNLYLHPGIYLEDLIINSKLFNIIMYLYIVFSFLWLVISLYIIWAIFRKKWYNISEMLLCWSVITIMIAAIDVSFMSVLAVDLKTAHNLGWPPSTPEPTTPDTTTPDTVFSGKDLSTSVGIVMSLAARGYILWIVNVVFAVCLLIAACKHRKITRPSLMQRGIINAYETDNRPFSMYDQVEIDKSFQNEGFVLDEHNIFNPIRSDDAYNNNNNNNNSINPLSNSTRSSLVYGQTPSYIADINKPMHIPQAHANGKLAKIGKSGGRRTPPQQVASPVVPHSHYAYPQTNSNMPYIPDPDYTPPGSPKSLPKGVLRPRSKYEY